MTDGTEPVRRCRETLCPNKRHACADAFAAKRCIGTHFLPVRAEPPTTPAAIRCSTFGALRDDRWHRTGLALQRNAASQQKARLRGRCRGEKMHRHTSATHDHDLEKYLNDTGGQDVWAVARHTHPPRSTTVPTITHQGAMADTHEKKVRMLADISFPAPIEYDGDEGVPGPRGMAHTLISESLVTKAFEGTSVKKSPGPDGLGPLAIRCLYGWETSRVVALVRAHIRLGTHPHQWKTARGATIPKPGRGDYGLAKSYRVISLLNCLGKIVEKVAAMLVSAACEIQGTFHRGQYGCRAQRSAVDPVGVVIAQTQEAWSQGRVVGALLMDVAAAFPSVARGCLLRKMRNMHLDEDLVRWTDSFMRDRRVYLSVDGQDSSPMEVTTGLPRGSPISPVLFAIYIADVHATVEGQVEHSRGISFVDDVTWLVEGNNIDDVVTGLEQCAAATLRWADSNAVRFEMSKTEAMLLSRRKKHWQAKGEKVIHVGEGHSVRFNREATRWLGIWLDSALTLRENRQRCLGRARKAEARIRRLVTAHGVPPASARDLQSAVVQGTLLYAAELTWNGRRGMEGEYQAAINRMGHASLGVFRSTPLGIVTAESALAPARALLDHRQARLALRLLARPEGGDGQEEILGRRSDLAGRIKERAGLGRRERAERQVWGDFRVFPGQVHLTGSEEALGVAKGWNEWARTAWTDGSRLDNGRVGAAVAWKEGGGWRGRNSYLGTNKEIFDAEVFAILQAVKALNEQEESGEEYTVFTDSQAAVARIRHDKCGPAQALAITRAGVHGHSSIDPRPYGGPGQRAGRQACQGGSRERPA